MLESLMTSATGVKRLYVPNSGPGSWWLENYAIDDAGPGTIAGYFGEVSSSELITGDDLAGVMGVTAGTSQNNDVTWLKFYIDGKILFVAKKSIRYSISWDSLDQANVVNGDEVTVINGRVFRVRLLKGLGPDTTGYVNDSHDNAATYGSEWNRLMYPVSIDIPNYPKTSQTIDNWAHFPQDDSSDGLNISLGNGRRSWCQETNPSAPANRVYRGNSVTYLSSNTSSTTGTNYGWRPVLELVTELLPPDNVYVFKPTPIPLYTTEEILLSPDSVHPVYLPDPFDLDTIK